MQIQLLVDLPRRCPETALADTTRTVLFFMRVYDKRINRIVLIFWRCSSFYLDYDTTTICRDVI